MPKMPKPITPADLRTQDTLKVEECLPAHMLFLMWEQAQKQNVVLRGDAIKYLNLACISPLSGLDELSISRIARKVDEAATTLLNDLSPDDPVEAMYVISMLVMLLVDERYILDARAQVVLVALLLLEDVKSDTPDVDGQEPLRHLKEAKWRQSAKHILRRAQIMGLFTVQSTIQREANLRG